MKKSVILTWFLSLTSIYLNAQTEFTIIKSKADSLREDGDLYNAIIEHKNICNTEPDNQNNIYNLACVLSIVGQHDSSFKYLYKSIQLDTSAYALVDPDFISLREDSMWEKFEDKLIQMLNIKFDNPYKDIAYAKKLWKMKAKDQAYYYELQIAEKKTGMNSPVSRAIWKLKHIYNEENQKDLEKLIEQKGWPKKSQVAGKAADAAFLIIQHSDLEKQKKYLPIIEKLCKENEANWESYALMYDRIQVNENKPQKYGSQVRFDEKKNSYELFPLVDESKVDEWRKEIGMSSLAEYVAHWNIKFNPALKSK